MFKAAQERYERGELFEHRGYIKDMLRNYGNGGNKIDLPKFSDEDYRKGVQFRAREKQHVKYMQSELASAQAQLKYERTRSDRYAEFINSLDFLTDNQATDAVSGSSGGDTNGDSGDSVLHTADNPGEDDGNDGGKEEIISSKTVKHERAPSRPGRPDGEHVVDNKVSQEPSSTERGAADTGGSRHDAADDGEPDVGGHGSEHSTAE